MREAGRAAQAEDIARSSEIPDVLPAPAQAEVRGRERGCYPGEAGSGVGVPRTTRAAERAGRGVPGGQHPS